MCIDKFVAEFLDIKSSRENNELLLHFTIHAKPKARCNTLKMEKGRLLVLTTKLPHKGEANMEIIRIISDKLDLPVSNIDIVKGSKGSLKQIICRYTFTRFKDEKHFTSKWKAILICLLLAVNNAFAAVISREELQQEITKMKDFTFAQYLDKMDQLQTSYDQYIDFQRRVCDGEFSNLLFDQNEPSVDKVDCLAKLKEIEISYTENSYIARKNYVEYLHEERLKELKKMHDEAILALQKRKD